MQKPIAAFINFIGAWQGQVSNMQFENKVLPEQAIQDFQTFSEDFISFFSTVTPRNTTAMRLEFKTFMTLQEYWLPLEQIIMQWQTNHYVPLLRDGQAEAKKYLEKLNVNLPGALVYFNKVANIKHMPYTFIPLLGMPYPFSGPENWSAIPHELGHYIYWSLGGDLLGTRERQDKMKNEAEQALNQLGIKDSMRVMIMDWFEEIFCDILGTQLGELEFVNSSTDFIKSRAGNENELTLNDGSHPPLCIRPYIGHMVLYPDDYKGKVELLFKDITAVNINNLEIKASIPTLDDQELTLPDENVIPENLQFETFRVQDILPGVETLVKFLSPEIKTALEAIREHRQVTQAPSAFSQIKKVVEMERRKPDKHKDKEVYELLLEPRVLEGGEESGPHTAWVHFTSHVIGVHYH